MGFGAVGVKPDCGIADSRDRRERDCLSVGDAWRRAVVSDHLIWGCGLIKSSVRKRTVPITRVRATGRGAGAPRQRQAGRPGRGVLEWTDGCRVCQCAANSEASCSNVGIACVLKAEERTRR
jgi:hypothetical protein